MLTKCNTCGAAVAQSAKRCPACGGAQPRISKTAAVIGVSIGAILMLPGVVSFLSDPANAEYLGSAVVGFVVVLITGMMAISTKG